MSLLALPSPINSSSTSANHNNVEYPEADHNHTNNGLLNVGGSPVAPTAGGLLRGHYAPGHLAPFLPHVHHHHHHPYVNPWMGSKLIGATGHPPALQVHHASGGNGGSGGAMQFNPYNFGMGSPAHVSSAAAGGSGGGIVGGGSSSGKRFRTKFTMEQREKMFEFSEKIGWRIQKQDEAAVQQFCAETGVKRHVLKVWMHNNKNTFGKKLLRFPEAFNAVPESSS
ncbi:hypothetical protein KP509_20G036600 [Ceratopteris richardii]|nr:hypothetical protein KP509_20G036600 [Ceratopteris richardii]